jgi:Holliday junction resolvase-like predicted endonuclease
MRKIYESELDRQNEAKVAEYLEQVWNCKFKKTVDLECIDGVVFTSDKKLAALIEIKKRNNASNKYPTYMISAQKWRNAMELVNKYEVPCMLVVEFTNGIFATKLKNDYVIQAGGRFDRGDAKDIEECAYIPMSDFRMVK